MPSLPDRPLSLDRRFVVAQSFAIAIPVLALTTLGGSALVLTADDVSRLATQDLVRAEGVRAEHPRVDIERDLSFFVFRARRYEVAFDDAQGVAHHARVREHDVSIAPLIVTGPPEVHYDPNDPSRVAVGFARQNVGAQRAAVGLLGAVGLGFLALAAWALARFSRRLRQASAAARGLRTASAAIIALERSFDSRGDATGELRLVLALEDRVSESRDTYRERSEPAEVSVLGARARRIDVVTPAGDPPIFLDAASTRVLVATTPSGEPVLVRRSGHPFALSPAEREALTAGTFGPPHAPTNTHATRLEGEAP